MNNDIATIDVVVDAKIYFQFYKFEKFSRTRGMIKLIAFAFFMSSIGIASIVMDALALGIVNLAIGLGLPIFNIRNFFKTLRQQIKDFDLEVPKTVYSLRFSKEHDGIVVTNHGGGDEALIYEWDEIHGVYRVDGCIYFFVLPNKAYLLPDGQASVETEELWSLFIEMMGSDKLYDKRKL